MNHDYTNPQDQAKILQHFERLLSNSLDTCRFQARRLDAILKHLQLTEHHAQDGTVVVTPTEGDE
jgi:hypothetical protein